ncbi:MAG: chromate transporter [Fusobacterium sp.]|nr:chromate transporter [Fusobacterium sp.]
MIYLQLFLVFFKIGLFSFGGGYTVLSLIQKDVVEEFCWITTGEFTEIVALSQVTPGPIAINSATYIGYKVTGNVFGSMFTTLGVVLPSFIVLALILMFLHRFKNSLVVERAFKALRPAVLGLILAAGLSLLKPENFVDTKSYIIFAGAMLLSLKWNVGIIPLIIGSGVLGAILY